MRRKITKQVSGAYTLTLPKKWIDFTELKAGDEITINESGKTLILEAEESKAVEEKKAVINYEDYKIGDHLRSFLGSLYRGGYDTIVINYEEPKVQDKIQHAMRTLYGFEMVEFNKTFCILKNIGLEAKVDISELIRKLCFSIQTIQKLIEEDIISKKLNNKDEIQYLIRTNVIKIKDLIMRTIIKQKLTDSKSLNYYLITENLWQIARSYHHLYNTLTEQKEITIITLNLLKDVEKVFDSTMIVSSKNYDAVKNRDFFTNLKLNIEKTIEKGENSEINAYLLHILLNIHTNSSKLWLINYEE
jgi:phosphate uptake regulator